MREFKESRRELNKLARQHLNGYDRTNLLSHYGGLYFGYSVRQAEAYLGTMYLPETMLFYMMSEPVEHVRAAVMHYVAGRPVPIQLLEQGLRDDAVSVRDSALLACGQCALPLSQAVKWLEDDSEYLRAAAIMAWKERDLPEIIIEHGLKDASEVVRRAAMLVCAGNDVPLRYLERGAQDSDWQVRLAALEASAYRTGADELIATMRTDPNPKVAKRAEALEDWRMMREESV